MADALTMAGIAGIESFELKNTTITALVNTLTIYESLCKFYRTFKAIIVDDNLIVDGLHIVGGENVSFRVVASGGKSYEVNNAVVFSIKCDRSNKNHRALVYELEFIDTSYVNERANIVKKSFSNITGTGVVQNIVSEFMKSSINIPVTSMGLLFQKNSHVIDGTKPLKAIDDIRKQITFSQYPTGITAFFHDRTQMQLAPVEYLLEKAMDTVTRYEERATWGSNYLDIMAATH